MRNKPMHDDVRLKCLARTRRGGVCQTWPVTGKKRCRMHGGARGSGAPHGNKNALKHGRYSADALAQRKARTQLYKQARQLLGRLR